MRDCNYQSHGARIPVRGLAVISTSSASEWRRRRCSTFELPSRCRSLKASDATMHRNSYDNDNSTFSPQGRLHQVSRASRRRLGMTRLSLSPPCIRTTAGQLTSVPATHTRRSSMRSRQSSRGRRASA